MSPEILRKPRETREVVEGQDLTAAKEALGNQQLDGMLASAAKVQASAIRVKKK